LYPTGWAAGYGVVRGLVRNDDHVIIDALAHSCLQEGAYAATRNVHINSHNNLQSVRRHLQRIRNRDRANAILVATEALFAADSDTPDIGALQELCREFEATLLVDVANDFGTVGEDGRGHIGLQQMAGKVDIVIGSFSKAFASNGGFACTHSPAVGEYLRHFGSTGTFSNAMSPIQAAIVLKALEIVRSEEGRQLRASLMRNVLRLRERLTTANLDVVGDPSPLVSTKVGDEAIGRMMSRRLPALGVAAHLVEFPAVAKGSSRFRLHVMAKHEAEHIDAVVERIAIAADEARAEWTNRRHVLSKGPLALAVGE
jgi:7-keto-8-aminopelargonate synthetase-like enzyme